MRLSDDKINHLSHVIIKRLREWDLASFSMDENDTRLCVKQGLINGLKTIENIEEKVRKTLLSYSRRIVEGSREWDVMFSKIFEEELQKVVPAKE